MIKKSNKKIALTCALVLLLGSVLGAISFVPINVYAITNATMDGTNTEEKSCNVSTIEERIKELDEKIKILETSLSEKNLLNEELQKQIEQLKSEKELLITELNNAKEKIASGILTEQNLKDELQKLNAKMDELSKKLEDCSKNKGISIEINNKVEVNLSKMEKLIEELNAKIEALQKESKDKEISKADDAKIKELEKQKEELKAELERLKTTNKNDTFGKEINSKIEELNKKNSELLSKVERLSEEIKAKNSNTQSSQSMPSQIVTPSQIPTAITTSKSESPKSIAQSTTSKGSENVNKEVQVRYPNKLTGKKNQIGQGDGGSSSDTSNSYYGTSKSNNSSGITNSSNSPSAPSTARGSVKENVNNANGSYPIHHGESNSSIYSADARQFVSFSTKSGKVFYLIINHDEKSENVILLTEVSEGDLMNMVDTKKPEVVEPTKVEPAKEVIKEVEPKKEEKKDNTLGTILLLLAVMGAVAGAGYYFKVVKGKEKEELAALEEPGDYIAEASDDNENKDTVDDEDELL